MTARRTRSEDERRTLSTQPPGSRSSSLKYVLIFCVLFSLAGALPLRSQLFTGSINGIVSDQNQKVIANASVTVINNATSDERQIMADGEGRYTFNQLNPGDYTITVSSNGFKVSKQSFSLQASQNLELNFQLSVGSASEQVVVTTTVSLLATEDANRLVTLTGDDVKSLPLPTHGALGAVWAQSGVVSIRVGQGLSAISGDQNTGRFALNGGRDESAAILVDGISVTAGDWGGAVGLPSAETIAEFQVFRNTYDVQYGKTDGGVVSLTTQGGGQTYHGGAFEHYQNAVLNANSWTNKLAGLSKTDYNMKLFGARAGGPLWRRKNIYIFGNYEGTRDTSPSTLLTTVPTDLERTGDFSQTFNSDGTLSSIYNPFSITSSSQPRTVFTGNKISAGMIDSVGKALVNLFPEPNRTGNSITGANNYAASGNGVTSFDRMDLRGDWVEGPKFSLFATLTKLWNSQSIPVLLGKGLDTNYKGINPLYRGLVAATYVPSSTLVVNLTGAYSTWHQFQISPSTMNGIDGSVIGLPESLLGALSTKAFPAFTFTNYASMGYARSLNYTLHNADFQVNISKLLHAHSLRIGYQMTIQQLNDSDETSGSFSFSRGMTSGPTAATASSTTGDAIASALLGTLSGATATVSVAPAAQQGYFAWYAEDTWKLTPRLTVNYGLRYEIQTPRTERHNRFNHFAPDVTSPLATETGLSLTGGLIYNSNSNRDLWDTEYKNFAPRVGIAFKAAKNTSLRAGYGVFYSQAITTGPTTPTDGYSITNTAVVSVNNSGLIPENLVSNPFPSGLGTASGSSLGLLTDAGNSVNAFLVHKPTPYVQSYSADIQIQPTSNSVIEIGYTGTQGRKLAWGYTRYANQLNPQYLSLGAALNTAEPNPFKGIITSGALAGSTIPEYKLLEAYPQFTSVGYAQDTPGASSSYNALNAKLQERYKDSVNLIFTYQWSKAIDNASETQNWEISDNARDYFHPNLERSISAHDIPQNFAATVIWKLPLGRGRFLGANMNRVLNGAVGGWEVSTIVNFYSGLPYQFGCSNTNSTYGYAVCRPQITDVAQVRLSHPTVSKWFNTAAVLQPATYTIGNMPRFVSNVRAGAAQRADLTLRKQFSLPHEMNFSVEASGYNVSNTPQYGRASATVGSSTFGQVTGLAAGSNPRTVEFSGRFNF